MLSAIAIAGGGAIGALARHGVNIGAAKMLGAEFPYGTLIVNVVGSFVMGVLIALFAHVWQPPQALRLFLVTGFLGGFTTFSTFSLDVATLLQRQDYFWGGAYMAASVFVSIAALFGGMFLIRNFVS